MGNKKEINKKAEPLLKSKSKFTEIYKVNNLENVNEKIRKETKRQNKIKEIIQIIEKNPETLEKLDISKLEIIDNYYKQKIMECRRKLAKSVAS